MITCWLADRSRAATFAGLRYGQPLRPTLPPPMTDGFASTSKRHGTPRTIETTSLVRNVPHLRCIFGLRSARDVLPVEKPDDDDDHDRAAAAAAAAAVAAAARS